MIYLSDLEDLSTSTYISYLFINITYYTFVEMANFAIIASFAL